MIITETLQVRIAPPNWKHWLSKGYDCKVKDVITVKVSELSPSSNELVTSKCDECSNTWVQTFQSVRKNDVHRCFQCSRNYVGSIIDQTKASAKNRERSGDKHPRWNPNKREFVEYSNRVRAISEVNYRNHKDKINPLDLPRTICGVPGGYQLDHKVSIKTGFTNGVSPAVIAEVSNLQMLTWKSNRTKGWADV